MMKVEKMKVEIVLLLLAAPSIFNNLGTSALKSYNPTISSLGEALAWVLLPSQCVNIILDLDAELIQVGCHLVNKCLGVF